MVDEADFISSDEQIYLEKIKKKSYRNFPYKTNAGVSKIYCIKKGDLWIGSY